MDGSDVNRHSVDKLRVQWLVRRRLDRHLERAVAMTADQDVTAEFAATPASPATPATPATPTTPTSQLSATFGRVRVRGMSGPLVSGAGEAGRTCTVRVALTVTETVRGSKVVAVAAIVHATKKAKKRLVTVLGGAATVDASQSQTLVVRLNPAGRSLLMRRSALWAELTASSEDWS